MPEVCLALVIMSFQNVTMVSLYVSLSMSKRCGLENHPRYVYYRTPHAPDCR